MSQEIEEIKKRVDIVDLVSSYVKLTKAGRNYRARCPFHQEKTPSFNVSPELQIYKCFGCQRGGDIFSFYQEIEGVEFGEALKDLAERAGVKLSHQKPQRGAREISALLEINNTALKFFRYLLKKHPVGEKARLYLKQRGIKPSTIDQFELGYAHKSWNSLGNYLLKHKFQLPDIVRSGLIVKKDKGGGWYDRFRGRLIFPLRDHRGRLVGFSGRILEKEAKGAKYINTPETLVFKKRLYLYGINLSKTDIKNQNSAIIVEGPFDLITPFQTGTTNIVASSGTALTSEQLKLLKRYARELVIAFDADTAGNQAAWRGIQLAKNEGLEVKIVTMEQGKDPDELARKDPEGWKRSLEKAENAYDFYFRSTLKDLNLAKPEHKRLAGQKLLPIIKAITDELERDHYLTRFAEELRIDKQTAIKALNQTKAAEQTPLPMTVLAKREPTSKQEYLLALILNASLETAQTALHKLGQGDFPPGPLLEIFKKLKNYTEGRQRAINLSHFRGTLTDESQKIFDRICLKELPEWINDPEKLEADIDATLKLVKKEALKRQVKSLSMEIKAAEKRKDQKTLHKLQEDFKKVSAKLASYAKKER